MSTNSRPSLEGNFSGNCDGDSAVTAPTRRHVSTPGSVEKNCGTSRKESSPSVGSDAVRQETQLLLVSSYKKKNRKINLPRFIPLVFFSPLPPQAFAGHKDGPIMVSLYMPLSDVKQNSKSVVSALPTVDTTVIIFTTASPHHCSVAAAADTPTRGYNLPVLSQFTSCKQRLHLGPSPGPCRGRAVLLLSPSGRRGDGLINMEGERERGRAEREEGREGGGMESTCGKLHKRWLFAPGEEKQLRKHVPVKVAKKK